MECGPSPIDLGQILPVLVMKSMFKEGEETNFDVLIEAMVNDKIVNSLLANIELPDEFKEMGDVICLMIQMDNLKTVLAALRGERVESKALDKALEMVINLQLLSVLSNAVGSGSSSGGSSGITG